MQLAFDSADRLVELVEERRGAVSAEEAARVLFALGHVPGALNMAVGEMEARAAEIPRDAALVAYCGHGERSSSALSILEGLGFERLYNLAGGFGAWKEVHDKAEPR